MELWAEGHGTAADALAYYGLEEIETLHLKMLPIAKTPASIAYRLAFAAWVRRSHGQGIALARNIRHAEQAVRWLSGRFHLVFEAHEVAPPHEHAREAFVLRASRGLVANAPGTLDVLRESHPVLPPSLVIHNAARPASGAPVMQDAFGVGVVGSVRPYKDPETVVRAASLVDIPITWVGADGPLGFPVRSEPAIASRDVPDRLRRFRTLLLPLSPGRFGEQLTSPLKLWDALASGVPLVAADTSAIARAAPHASIPYRPGDASSLADALVRADRDEVLRASVVRAAVSLSRTWAQRACEVEGFVDGLLCEAPIPSQRETHRRGVLP